MLLKAIASTAVAGLVATTALGQSVSQRLDAVESDIRELEAAVAPNATNGGADLAAARAQAEAARDALERARAAAASDAAAIVDDITASLAPPPADAGGGGTGDEPAASARTGDGDGGHEGNAAATPRDPSPTATRERSRTASAATDERSADGSLPPLDSGAPLASDVPGLFQRVLTRPGGTLVDADGNRTQLDPFTILYVYGEASAARGERMLAVGRGRTGPDGWIPFAQTETWRSMLVMEYAARTAERRRVLFFSDKDALLDLISDYETGAARVEDVYAAVGRGANAEGTIVTVEPKRAVGREQTYLMPIIDHDEAFFDYGDAADVTLLQLAGLTGDATTRETAATTVAEIEQRQVDESALRDFVVGVAFVIDTTRSMGPYIEATKNFVENVYGRLDQAGLTDRFRFGLVGFRDNLEAAPDADYVTRVYRDLQSPASVWDMLKDVRAVLPAGAPTQDWREDAFAGLRLAARTLDWDEVDARIMVLVTDASARSESDLLAHDSGYGAETLRAVMDQRDISVYTMHLRTHEARQVAGQSEIYRAESQYSTIGTYMPVEGDTAAAFRAALEAVEMQVVRSLTEAAKGRPIQVDPRMVDEVLFLDGGGSLDEGNADIAAAPISSGIFRYQQEFLGDYAGEKPPAFYRAWAADRDLLNQSVRALDVSVLLTRQQVEVLAQAIADLIDDIDAKRARISEIQSTGGNMTGRMVSDPLLPKATAGFLEALPYRSDLTSITVDEFLAQTAQQQEDMLNVVRAKLRGYGEILSSDSRWMQINDDSADDLYPIPLRDLP